MSWFEMKEQRRENRKRFGWREGHRIRSEGYAAIIDKKTGDVLCVARNGCFGRLSLFDKDLHQEWALGTRGQE